MSDTVRQSVTNGGRANYVLHNANGQKVLILPGKTVSLDLKREQVRYLSTFAKSLKLEGAAAASSFATSRRERGDVAGGASDADKRQAKQLLQDHESGVSWKTTVKPAARELLGDDYPESDKKSDVLAALQSLAG